MSGPGELEAILHCRRLDAPCRTRRFRILPQDFATAFASRRTRRGALELLTDGVLVGETLVARVPSAVNQHSRPLECGAGISSWCGSWRVLPQLGVHPQLQIAQSLGGDGDDHRPCEP